jgi:hypothetical protein
MVTMAGMVMMLSLVACSSDETDETAVPTNTGSGHQDLLACESDAFAVTLPLESSDYDPALGGLQGTAQESYIVHTTQLALHPDGLADLVKLNSPVVAQLAETPGLVAYSLAVDGECNDVRTLGIWESTEAMYAFVMSGAHVDAMGRAPEVSLTGRATHWQASKEEVNALTWETAKAKIAGKDEAGLYGE